jgi:hypothetical protein
VLTRYLLSLGQEKLYVFNVLDRASRAYRLKFIYKQFGCKVGFDNLQAQLLIEEADFQKSAWVPH